MARHSLGDAGRYYQTITANSSAASAVVAKPLGVVYVTTASSGKVTLPDGDYNGQMVFLSGADGSNDTTVYASDSSTVIRGRSVVDVSEGQRGVMCIWSGDGSGSDYWHGV